MHVRYTNEDLYVISHYVMISCDYLHCIQVLFLYQLVERGYNVSLDDPLRKFCPNFSMDTEGVITLRQMAAYVSNKFIEP